MIFVDKKLKISFYLFLCGVFALFVALLRQPNKTVYTATDVLGASSDLVLFVEPDDGRQPLLDYINSSSNIAVEVYILSDPQIITALASKSAQIILEQHPFGGNNLNQKTKNLLGNLVNWSNSAFALTHAKFMVFDDKLVCILNLNLTKTAFEKNREYNICSTNPQNILEAKNIFSADWNRQDYEPVAQNLVVSPNNSRPKLAAFLNSAQKQLDLELEVVTDEKMVNIICEKSKNIDVRLIVPEFNKVDNKIAVEKLKDCGAQTKNLYNPYPHAKLIVADLDRAYVGSINFTAQSLDRNRELGILVSQPDILTRLNTYFQKDWDLGN